METLDSKIQRFLTIGSGSGYGDGDGYGDGYGDGILRYDGYPVHAIDGIQTIIYSVKGNIAKGVMINNDLTLKDCFIAKSGNCFAHGGTVKEATKDAIKKHLLNSPMESRIEAFMTAFPDAGKKYPASSFYEWHYTLTGSCTMGRDNFMRNKGISMSDSFTVPEFIEITKDSYGSDAINLLHSTILKTQGNV